MPVTCRQNDQIAVSQKLVGDAFEKAPTPYFFQQVSRVMKFHSSNVDVCRRRPDRIRRVWLRRLTRRSRQRLLKTLTSFSKIKSGRLFTSPYTANRKFYERVIVKHPSCRCLLTGHPSDS